ncbi:MAG: DUF1932 domain-containing protein [Micromonosporaceae bacterium]
MSPSPTLAVLHPGQMGAAIAGQLRRRGIRVLWCRDARSASTAERATEAGLEAVDHLSDLLVAADIVLSICPPEFAEDVAHSVAEHGYAGLYVDANAISPERCNRIADLLMTAGCRVVDGSIIGPPPMTGRTARLYLAGDAADASRVVDLFTGTSVEAVKLDGHLGAASALKMAYASYQKATRTLAAVAHALAADYGVTNYLLSEAARSTRSPLAEPDYLPSVAARAWRWTPEMREIADALSTEGLPSDLARATASVLARWASERDRWDISVDAALAGLRTGDQQSRPDLAEPR